MGNKGHIRISTEDIVGSIHGKLKVLSYDGHWYESTNGGERMRHRYFCQCSCGNCKYVRRGPLVSDVVHSCGCSRKKGAR